MSVFAFKQFVPRVPSSLVLHMYEEIFYRAVLEVDRETNPASILVEAVTTQKDNTNPEGISHSIRLYLRGPLRQKNFYVYGGSAILTAPCSFEFSYRAKKYKDAEYTLPPTQPATKGSAKVMPFDPDYVSVVVCLLCCFENILKIFNALNNV
ncbi:hypothetical protein HELRODRAFT_177201 [Helobdella robusta]|uniref:Uncharacterized protein n=1 Tax=Helobdella robusta TaxID=6412 RepID=T1FBC4_HELRO|nr:hypothetical protein HELRODRAFT_177201 [Helobdella robusta]ESN98316.1 hypothetical protein HELRODRAFT_177201 [Helobdella robusta]